MIVKDSSAGRTTPRVIASGLMAISSALLFAVLLFEDLGELIPTSWSDAPWNLLVRYLAAMSVAGGLIGFALSGLFGRSGVAGWALALAAGVVAATGSGLVGSLLGGLPDIVVNGLQGRALVAIAAGALVLPFAIADWPFLILVWLSLLTITHLWIRSLRRHAPI